MPVWWLRTAAQIKGDSMSHASARFTLAGRLLVIRRVDAGMPQAYVAAQMGLSRSTVAKWQNRWVEHGEAGFQDWSPRPQRSAGGEVALT